jgi:protocatechuate 3,4-dioxygenase beta subunit
MAVCLLAAFVGAARGADLRGVVMDGNGKAVEGATVYVLKVDMLVGRGPAQSLYADWGKKALTDAEGKFVIEKMDAQLRFKVLVAAEGRLPVVKEKVNPASELKVKLKDVPEETKSTEWTIRGRVTDEEGKPVWGAEVVPFGFKSGERRWWPATGWPEAATVTDQKGEFLYLVEEAGILADIRINGRGFAPVNFELQAPGDDVKEYVVGKGATIEGRVVKDGKGLANVVMGAYPVKDGPEEFNGRFSARTDENGKYVFEHVSSGREYRITAAMSSLGERGAFPEQRVTTGEAGETASAGDVEVGVARTIAGRVKLEDGKPVPKGLKLTVTRLEARDQLKVDVDSEGKFKVSGIPDGETIWVDVPVKGYTPSKENTSFDPLNGSGFVGLVDQDILDLCYVFHPGRSHSDYENNNASRRQGELHKTRLEGVPEGKQE